MPVLWMLWLSTFNKICSDQVGRSKFRSSLPSPHKAVKYLEPLFPAQGWRRLNEKSKNKQKTTVKEMATAHNITL